MHNLTVDKGAFPYYADPARSAQDATAWGIGANWYLNKNVKVMVDYERTRFTGGSSSGDRPDESAAFVRVQVSF